jgi:hypothetical protein
MPRRKYEVVEEEETPRRRPSWVWGLWSFGLVISIGLLFILWCTPWPSLFLHDDIRPSQVKKMAR